MSFDFYKRAAIVCRAIPYGKAATYGQIALLCGKPKNARQVGYALNRNRLGDDIPAYRVVNARGILSGAAAFDTADMQKLLLENEGVGEILGAGFLHDPGLAAGNACRFVAKHVKAPLHGGQGLLLVEAVRSDDNYRIQLKCPGVAGGKESLGGRIDREAFRQDQIQGSKSFRAHPGYGCQFHAGHLACQEKCCVLASHISHADYGSF